MPFFSFVNVMPIYFNADTFYVRRRTVVYAEIASIVSIINISTFLNSKTKIANSILKRRLAPF